MCELEEERVQRVLDNHMYIEHPLQATYTAAVFFLFQNAVVKDSIVVANGSSDVTSLAFDGNTQLVALTASIPFANSVYTQLGCLILVVGVAIALIWTTIVQNSPHRSDLLTGITKAEVMARAKLDDRSFPQFLLHRHITLTRGTFVERLEFDKFIINSLTLREEKEAVDQQRPTRSMDDNDFRGPSEAA